MKTSSRLPIRFQSKVYTTSSCEDSHYNNAKNSFLDTLYILNLYVADRVYYIKMLYHSLFSTSQTGRTTLSYLDEMQNFI